MYVEKFPYFLLIIIEIPGDILYGKNETQLRRKVKYQFKYTFQYRMGVYFYEITNRIILHLYLHQGKILITRLGNWRGRQRNSRRDSSVLGLEWRGHFRRRWNSADRIYTIFVDSVDRICTTVEAKWRMGMKIGTEERAIDIRNRRMVIEKSGAGVEWWRREHSNGGSHHFQELGLVPEQQTEYGSVLKWVYQALYSARINLFVQLLLTIIYDNIDDIKIRFINFKNSF